MSERIDTPPFWIVWTQQGKNSRVQHPTQDAAQEAARGLASLYPGQQFFVLCPVSSVVKSDVAIRRLRSDE